MTSSRFSPVRTIAGVVYESGDSRWAIVGRSTLQIVRPFALLMRSTYEGSSVFMPCSTCTNTESPKSIGDEP